VSAGHARQEADGSYVFQARQPAPEPAAISQSTPGAGTNTVQRATPSPAIEPAPRAFDPDDPEELDRLAARLYPHLSPRLRDELRLDRERAGLVTNIYLDGA
ncbi:MAG: hypothetical protein ACRD0J_10750, partial [Acidimicrobiales bacterium]